MLKTVSKDSSLKNQWDDDEVEKVVRDVLMEDDRMDHNTGPLVGKNVVAEVDSNNTDEVDLMDLTVVVALEELMNNKHPEVEAYDFYNRKT